MNRMGWVLSVLAFATAANASWYWPFGDDKPEPPKVSALMRPAVSNINEAADYAASGKINEAILKYREALAELDRVEADTNNADRIDTPEFATLRTKRAYVSAAIDTMLLMQARENAKSVAITDTTELERKMLKLKEAREGKAENERPELKRQESAVQKNKAKEKAEEEDEKTVSKAEKRIRSLKKKLKAKPGDRKLTLQLASAMITDDKGQEAVDLLVPYLKRAGEDLAAINLLAVAYAVAGKTEVAEATLNDAIKLSPTDYHAYLNRATLILQSGGDREKAQLFYEKAVQRGAPRDLEMEQSLK